VLVNGLKTSSRAPISKRTGLAKVLTITAPLAVNPGFRDKFCPTVRGVVFVMGDDVMLTYVIEQVGTGFCKIGKTANVTRRLRNLQGAQPQELRLWMLFEYDIETDLHWRFKEKRARGEWFRLDDDDKKYLLWLESVYDGSVAVVAQPLFMRVLTAAQMAKKVLLKLFRRMGTGVSFVEMARELDDAGIDSDGTHKFSTDLNPHIIFWAGMSKAFVAALGEIYDDHDIEMISANRMVYQEDGMSPGIELAEDLEATEDRWLPVVFDYRIASIR